MPNFITNRIKPLNFAFGNDDIKFEFELFGRCERLIFTKNHDEEFFITIKQRQDGNFVVKGDKLSKPPRLSSLQKALCLFRDTACDKILSQAIQNKSQKEPNKVENIVNINELGELKDFVEKYEKIYIEIGFGSGRHLLFRAKEEPNTAIIGIEVYKPSMEQTSKLARASKFDNIRLINTDARLLLSLLPSNLIDKIFLHFPVPWDDAPHRRVVSEDFAMQCERVLKKGGVFELRSDSLAYTNFTSEVFLGLKNAKIFIQKNVANPVVSKYEDRWQRQNKDIFDLYYTCESISSESKKLNELKFDDFYDLQKIKQNFSNLTLKGDDYFVHFEELYSNENLLIIRVAFGAFNKPEHSFIKLGKGVKYFIKAPLLTTQNANAHEKIKEILAKWSR